MYNQSLLKPIRFQIIFYICWFSWAQSHAIVLTHFGFSWRLALIDSAVSNLLLGGVCILLAKSFQYYTPQKNKYSYIVGLVAVLSLLWLFVSRFILMQIINDPLDYYRFFSRTFVIRAAFGVLIIGCMALVSMLWYTLMDQRQIEERKTEAERLAKDAELIKLRQQLQPHFLFNSLNSINALIATQPAKARSMVQQLSDFLRGTLKKEEHQWVSLADELQHLQLYLDIEKVRFGHRLETCVKNNTNIDAVKIPAMLLQPLVENAIKFGLYDTTGNIEIVVETNVQDGNLEVTVSNPFDPETSEPQKGTGFGLHAARRRLYLLFARNDLLTTSHDKMLFTTTIKIPQPI